MKEQRPLLEGEGAVLQDGTSIIAPTGVSAYGEKEEEAEARE